MVNLVTVKDRELMKVGTWQVHKGGEFQVTPELIQSAIKAHEAGVLRKPVVRLGHNDPRFSGDPAVGWIDNLRVSDDGTTLVGDHVGVPQWLADIMPSAYPSLSIEGMYDYAAPDGSQHDFVLTGLALLGATEPGIAALKSVQDVAKLYEVDEVAAAVGQIGGTPVRFTVEAASPKPYGNVDYADPKNGKYPIDTAEHVRAAWAYINMPKNQKGYNAAELAQIQSRIKAAAKKFGITIEAASASQPEEGAVVALPDKLAEALGIDASADEDTILAAVEALKKPAVEPEPDEVEPKLEPIAAATGVVQIEQAKLDELTAAAAQGVEARARQIAEDDDRTVMAAIGQGKIAPARKQHWLDALKADRDGTKQVLASLAAGLIPVSEVGHQGVAGHVGFEGSPDPEQQVKDYALGMVMARLGIPVTKEGVNN